ncbi:MAG: TonB-dependent receptor, partial [Prevotellaceae bacterium]|nr:TonB-dependent receptor [Prevotellaceae bacterium]
QSVSLLALSFGIQAQNVGSRSLQDTAAVADTELNEIVITSHTKGSFLPVSSLAKKEIITKGGLMKMACCNLSESFENSASVTVGFTDAVSGARQIQLLGLSGIYSQILAENIPALRGLASTFGWNYIPSHWLESIQISKGSSSVTNGYESVTGQINLEFIKPNNTEPLSVDFYADDDRHFEGNLTSSVKLNDKLWTGLMLSGTTGTEVHDENSDNFLDMPKVRYINAYNRWFYLNGDKGIQSRTGIKFLYENRIAGQDSLCHIKHGIPYRGIELFETVINNRNAAIENKTGFAVGNRENQSIGIINSFAIHEQNLRFGKKTFDGIQKSYYANVLFSSYIRTTEHRYTVGASFVYDDYRTAYLDSLQYSQTPLTHIDRTETVTGVFGEYTYTHPAGLTVALGLRADYNSCFGWLSTPRGNVKYDINRYITLRVSAGRGFRSPNAVSENIGLMASSRRFDLAAVGGLDIEKAWNFGGNLALNIPVWNGQTAILSVDYFRTDFQNRFITDIERDRNAVYFYSLGDGRSYAGAWQADFSTSLFKGFDVYAAFRYSSNRITYTDGDLQYETEQALVSRYRGLLNLSYATPLRRWIFDVTAQVNGPSRLPGLNGYDSETVYSPVFPVYFAQATRNSKYFDIYLGVENILAYTQRDPIREWETPFSRDFDASMIWGPLRGRRIYAGVRIRIGEMK